MVTKTSSNIKIYLILKKYFEFGPAVSEIQNRSSHFYRTALYGSMIQSISIHNANVLTLTELEMTGILTSLYPPLQFRICRRVHPDIK